GCVALIQSLSEVMGGARIDHHDLYAEFMGNQCGVKIVNTGGLDQQSQRDAFAPMLFDKSTPCRRGIIDKVDLTLAIEFKGVGMLFGANIESQPSAIG